MVDASASNPAPSATGTLASRPLVHLLVYARNRRLTGKLVVDGPDGQHGAIDLWRGRVCGVATKPPTAYFGAVAHEMGRVDTRTLDATLLEISKTRRLHGEVLIERGAITHAERDEILAEQACRKIHALFALPPEGSFAFYEGHPAAEPPPLVLDPIKPTWWGLRSHAPAGDIPQVLGRLESVTLQITNEGPIASAGFAPEERALCAQLANRPMTLAEVHVTSELPASQVDLLVYLLVITKCLEPTAAAPARVSQVPASQVPTSHTRATAGTRLTPPDSRALREIAGARSTDSGEVRVSLSFRVSSASVAPPPSSRPPSSKGSVPAAPVFALGPADFGAAGIARRAQAIEQENFFEVLGLPDRASAEAARAAYFRLAKLWHPDRLVADLAPFASEVETVFRHMTRANATLTDPDARQAYIATRDPKASLASAATKPRPQIIREIEQAIGRREFLSAEQAAGDLASLKEVDADAKSLVAWARSHGGEASEEILRATLASLDAILRSDAYCERAHYYRGMIQKRLGNSAAAIRDFTRVVHLDPKHVDAARELRLHEMRSRKGSGEHALDLLRGKVKEVAHGALSFPAAPLPTNDDVVQSRSSELQLSGRLDARLNVR